MTFKRFAWLPQRVFPMLRHMGLVRIFGYQSRPKPRGGMIA